MKLAPVRHSSVADQVARKLRAEILSGRLPAGAKLPGERDLARDLGTNRNTLREALRTLEALGLVRARQGDGVSVLDYRRDGELQVLPLFLTEGQPEERAGVLADLLGLRRVLIVDMAAIAAARADAAAVAALRLRLDDIRVVIAAGGNGDRLPLIDLEFYRTLATATHSLVAQWSFNTFARAYLDIVQALPSLWITPPGYVDTLTALLDAIEAHDADGTRRILDRHLRQVDRTLVPLLTGRTPGPRE
ncbi:MAG: FadR family transcriptional regulator [Deltaproteobacteria bacterium]|nr:FadR family transcriptional regulator [Deltaproteobacteria bacterium]